MYEMPHGYGVYQHTWATIQNFRRRQERYRPKQTQPTFQGYDDVGVAWLINGYGCGFVCMHIKTIQSSNKYILNVGMEKTETRIGMEGICITYSCIPPL